MHAARACQGRVDLEPGGPSRIVVRMSGQTPAPLFERTPAALPGGAYRANLYVYDPFGRVDWYALPPSSFVGDRYFTIGRGTDCDIALQDGSVSSHHAVLALEKGALCLRDLGSTNGVLLNELRVQAATLEHGDVVRIGATDLRYLLSFKAGPIQLVLEFTEGPNAGRTVATFGSSTTIGRLNCAVNLSGVGVAPQHVRVDAYGESLLYVVALRRENEAWLNGERVVGVQAARDGDTLRVGEHSMRLRARPSESAFAEIPEGLGTLDFSAPELQGEAGAAAPQVYVSSEAQRRLDAAHLEGLRGGDRTALELRGLDAVDAASLDEPTFVASSRRATVTPPRISRAAHPPLPGARGGTRSAAWDAIPSLPVSSPASQQAQRRFLVLWVALLVTVVFGIAVLTLRLASVRRTVPLVGQVEAASTLPVAAGAAGVLDAVFVKAGDRVAAGDALFRLIDPAVRAQIAALNVDIEALQQRAPRPVMVPASRNKLDEGARAAASAELKAAQAATAAAAEAFDRREGSASALEAAKQRFERAQAASTALAAIEPEIVPARVVHGSTKLEDVARIAELLRLRNVAEAKLQRTVVAPRAGLVTHAASSFPELGAAVTADSPLLSLVDTGTVRVRVSVSRAQLEQVGPTPHATLVIDDGSPARRSLRLEPRGAAQVVGQGAVELEGRVDNSAGGLVIGQGVRLEVEAAPVDGLTWLIGDGR